ncbi:hypothetical protein ACEPAH_9539 [Sanghuangporus vaninii]
MANLIRPVLTTAEVLKATEADQAAPDDGYLAMDIHPDEESAVADSTVVLFRACGFTGTGRVARTKKKISLLICGENRDTKTDGCIMDDNGEILLLVQEDKRHMEGSDPEPQLIAEAIAAFTVNNQTQVNTLDLPLLQFKVIPIITLTGGHARPLQNSSFRRSRHCRTRGCILNKRRLLMSTFLRYSALHAVAVKQLVNQ